MNTKLRIAVALAVFGAIMFAGIGAPAWADRLNLRTEAPSAGDLQASLPVGARPQGTVITTGPQIPITGGQATTVASCATVLVKAPPAGVEYTASVVAGDTLPVIAPGNLISCAIMLVAQPGAQLGSEAIVCFPVPPTQAGFAYYHDGSQWVKSTLEAIEGQACINVPASAGTPSFAGLFDK